MNSVTNNNKNTSVLIVGNLFKICDVLRPSIAPKFTFHIPLNGFQKIRMEQFPIEQFLMEQYLID